MLLPVHDALRDAYWGAALVPSAGPRQQQRSFTTARLSADSVHISSLPEGVLQPQVRVRGGTGGRGGVWGVGGGRGESRVKHNQPVGASQGQCGSEQGAAGARVRPSFLNVRNRSLGPML